MSRQDAPLSGLQPARLPITSSDLILLSQVVNGKLKSTYGTLAELMVYLFDANGGVDDYLNDKGFLKGVGHDGTLAGDGTSLLPLTVKRSTDAGNLLQVRANGLYYGVEAPADISHLYVDSLLGDDVDGTGTKLLPFLTLNKALTKVNGTSRQTIHLKAGNDRPEYILDRGKQITTNGTLVVTAYGDTYIDGEIYDTSIARMDATADYRVYHGTGALAIERPRIRGQYIYNPNSNTCGLISFSAVNGATINFIACEIFLKALDPNAPANAQNSGSALGYCDAISSLILTGTIVTDDRRYPDTVGDGFRNGNLSAAALGLGSGNILLRQSMLRVSNPDRAEDDYKSVFGQIYTLFRGTAFVISPGFAIPVIQDNFYSIMNTHGETSVLSVIIKDTSGDVMMPKSDYTNFSRPGPPKISSVATDESLDGNGTVDDPLVVKRSPDPSNLLQFREDGLYYGTEAPPDLSHIYVDSLLGSDSNTGTIGSPFKTINKALTLLLKGTTQTIHLKCGDDRPTYVIDGRYEISAAQDLTILAYGDTNLDGAIAATRQSEITITPGYRYYNSPTVLAIKRPRIRFTYLANTVVKYVYASGFQLSNGGSLTFSNINIQLRADDPLGDSTYLNWARSFIYGDASSFLNLKYCFITDNRVYPESFGGSRNISIADRSDGLGVTNVTVSLVTVVVAGRPATDYSPIFHTIASLYQTTRSTVDYGFGVAVMADNIYPIMDTYGENKMIAYITKDSRGDVLLPISDYLNFT